MSSDIDNNNNNNNITATETETVDELKDTIKEEQQKEISYILEASQIDDKRSKFLAKQNEYKVRFDDGKIHTFKRKPLSVRKNKEIDDLRSAFVANQRSTIAAATVFNKKISVNGKTFDNTNDILFEAYKLTAEYCLGMTEKQYDSAIWEDEPDDMDNGIYGLRSILTGVLLRAVHGVAYFPQP
jgi:DNA gyrase/topoisomerase IV subunit A